MNHAIVRIFDDYDHAQRARDALLAEGFAADRVSIRIANDEAGAVEGNFTVGNSQAESGDNSYAHNYGNARQLSQCIVTVDAGDDGAAARAADIMAGFGARDADPAARFGL
jgi:hypothetical protein